MFTDKLLGKLDSIKGYFMESWGKATNNNEMIGDGRRLKFFGKERFRYGLTKAEVKARLSKFVEESKGASHSSVKY